MSEPTSIVSAYSPPFRIVSKYFVTAISSFVLLNLFLLLNHSYIVGHHFTPKILAITHIATLGWITMIIFGALFQLIPVVLEVKLFSENSCRSSVLDLYSWRYWIGLLLLDFYYRYVYEYCGYSFNSCYVSFFIQYHYDFYPCKKLEYNRVIS
ncbi:MAG: hypothetical protein HND40_02605 [Ignavibacteriota bacterium]|nr:MAG: hypothetical protein HND40_02605 [Ignavibacteriota bacterium]